MTNSGGSTILMMASIGTLLLGVKISSRLVSTPASSRRLPSSSFSVATHVAMLGTMEKVPVSLATPWKASMVPSAASREASVTLAVVCS